ncbi:Hypothetical protein CINCED_3A011389 [Cinara cedri]|uniref:Uncharacterized protein n=1 Tax=Cinara cedri TaxID=506608 RepID=A0A5E4N188_9HEMI|nr:Hypothetical protein CINCED_3A011389 [Cinara cedri]
MLFNPFVYIYIISLLIFSTVIETGGNRNKEHQSSWDAVLADPEPESGITAVDISLSDYKSTRNDPNNEPCKGLTRCHEERSNAKFECTSSLNGEFVNWNYQISCWCCTV